MDRRLLIPLFSALILAAPGLRGQDQAPAVPAEAGAVVPAAPAVDPAAQVDGKAAADLVPLLGHARFKVRQAAQDRLTGLLESAADEVVAACYKAYAGDHDPEVKMRARAVLVAYVVLEESMRGRGFVGIGLMLHPLFDPGGKLLFGVKVTQVMPEFPGAKAGLKAGDLITGVDDLALDDQEADQKFMDFIGKKGPGKTVTLKISRNGEGKEYKVTLARRPDNLESRKAQDPEELFQAFLARRRADPGPK